MKRRIVILVVAPLLALLGAGAAWAFWTATGSGTASASTGTLSAPGKPAGTVGASTVALTWAKSTVSGGGTISYGVERRTDPGSTWTAACDTPVVGATNVTCNDVPGAGSFVYRVKAAYSTWTAQSLDSDVVTVASAAATSFAVSAPSSATAGTAFSFTVTAKTASNATATGYAGTVHFTSSDALAVLPSDYTFTGGDSGAHTFSTPTSGATLKTAGSQTIFVTASGVSGSNSVTVSPAAAANVSATAGTTPQSATVGTTFGTALAAKVTDLYGNVVLGASVLFTAPTTGASGTFAPSATVTTTATTNASGVATATAFTAGTAAGSYAVSAAASGASSGSYALTNNPGAGITVSTSSGSPQSATVNAVFGTAMAARVSDSFGNGVSGVSVLFAAPGSGASGKFANGTVTTSVATDASGIAIATAFTAGTTAGSYALSATAIGATSASFSLTNNPGAAAKLAFTTMVSGNQTVTTTATIGPFTVQAQDAFSNPVVNSGSAVTLGLATNATGSIKFFTTVPGASSAGAVTIPNGASSSSAFYYADNKTGSPTLTAAGIVNGVTVTPATTNGFTVVPAAVKLTFTAVVSGSKSATATATIGPFTVQAQDAAGNPVTNNGSAVTLALSSTSSGTKFFAAQNGSSATAVTILNGASSSPAFYYADAKAGSPTLTAAGTVNGVVLTSATTGGFTVVPAPASKLAISGPTSGASSTQANIGPFSVQIRDQFDNAVNSVGTTTVSLGRDPGAGSGTAIFATVLNGTGVTSVVIASGQSSAVFYFGYSKANASPAINATSGSLSLLQSWVVATS